MLAIARSAAAAACCVSKGGGAGGSRRIICSLVVVATRSNRTTTTTTTTTATRIGRIRGRPTCSGATVPFCCRSFSSSDGDDGDTDTAELTTAEERHRLFNDQMDELKREREDLYGFTEDDEKAWSDYAAGKHPQHESSFLDEINKARFEASEAEALASGGSDEDCDDENTDTGVATASTTTKRNIAATATETDLEWSYSSIVTTTPESTSASDTTDETNSARYEALEAEALSFTKTSATLPPHLHHSHPHDDDAETSSSDFSHVSTIDEESGITTPRMVDVGSKPETRRIAIAQSKVVFPPEVVNKFHTSTTTATSSTSTKNELTGPKGPIFATAKLAGIMAAKKTSDLIPLCHPLPLDQVDIDIKLIDNDTVAVVRCKCCVSGKTGVEMEALTGASIAALTIYDMTKAVSHKIRIEDTVLISKTGGKRTVLEEDDESNSS